MAYGFVDVAPLRFPVFVAMLPLAAALLACGGSAQLVRHEREGATPPSGPRAVGPLMRRGRGMLSAGVMSMRTKQTERSVDRGGPSNVTLPTLFQLRYSHGVTRGLELGGDAFVAPTKWGRAASRDMNRSLLPDTTLAGGDFQLRALFYDGGIAYVAFDASFGVMSLPYHKRVTLGSTGDVDDRLGFVQVQVGPWVGVRVSPALSLGSGALAQDYPFFLTTTVWCASTCANDEPATTKTVLLLTPFLWLSLQASSLELTAYAFTSTSDEPLIASTMPYGGGLQLGWIIDFAALDTLHVQSPLQGPRGYDPFR